MRHTFLRIPFLCCSPLSSPSPALWPPRWPRRRPRPGRSPPSSWRPASPPRSSPALPPTARPARPSTWPASSSSRAPRSSRTAIPARPSSAWPPAPSAGRCWRERPTSCAARRRAARRVEDITAPGTDVILEPGDAIYYEDDVVHTARGAGDEAAVVFGTLVLTSGEPLLMPADMDMSATPYTLRSQNAEQAPSRRRLCSVRWRAACYALADEITRLRVLEGAQMDANRFDALSRIVGEQANRRDALKATVGGALGLLGLTVLDEDALGKGYDGQKCKKNKNCKTGLHCKAARRSARRIRAAAATTMAVARRATPARTTTIAAAVASAATTTAAAKTSIVPARGAWQHARRPFRLLASYRVRRPAAGCRAARGCHSPLFPAAFIVPPHFGSKVSPGGRSRARASAGTARG